MSAVRKIKIEAVYDPVLCRYRAACPECGFAAVRAERESAEHVLSQHVAYEHDAEPS